MRNATQVAINTTNDTPTGMSDSQLVLLGVYAPTSGGDLFWKGRCGLAYLTTGVLTDPQITSLDTIIANYLTAIGRS